MSRTRAKYRIAQRVKYEDTRPEQIVKDILTSDLGFILAGNKAPPVPVMSGEETIWLNPDIVIHKINWEPRIVIEVDGPHHDTPIQQGKARRRDGWLVKAGYKVIHVPSVLTENQKLRDYLKIELNKAIQGTEAIVRIAA